MKMRLLVKKQDIILYTLARFQTYFCKMKTYDLKCQALDV